MDRALSRDDLIAALGDAPAIPSPKNYSSFSPMLS